MRVAGHLLMASPSCRLAHLNTSPSLRMWVLTSTSTRLPAGLVFTYVFPEICYPTLWTHISRDRTRGVANSFLFSSFSESCNHVSFPSQSPCSTVHAFDLVKTYGAWWIRRMLMSRIRLCFVFSPSGAPQIALVSVPIEPTEFELTVSFPCSLASLHVIPHRVLSRLTGETGRVNQKQVSACTYDLGSWRHCLCDSLVRSPQ